MKTFKQFLLEGSPVSRNKWLNPRWSAYLDSIYAEHPRVHIEPSYDEVQVAKIKRASAEIQRESDILYPKFQGIPCSIEGDLETTPAQVYRDRPSSHVYYPWQFMSGLHQRHVRPYILTGVATTSNHIAPATLRTPQERKDEFGEFQTHDVVLHVKSVADVLSAGAKTNLSIHLMSGPDGYVVGSGNNPIHKVTLDNRTGEMEHEPLKPGFTLHPDAVAKLVREHLSHKVHRMVPGAKEPLPPGEDKIAIHDFHKNNPDGFGGSFKTQQSSPIL